MSYELGGGRISARKAPPSRELAAVPARLRPAQPAVPHRPRPSRTRRRPHRARRPAVLPDRRRQDRGVPGAHRVHVRDPAAAGHGRLRRRRPQRGRRRRRAHAVHAAAAHRAAVPAGRGADLRGRGAAPARTQARGATTPFRIGLWVGGGRLAELVRGRREPGRRRARRRARASTRTSCRRSPARGAATRCAPTATCTPTTTRAASCSTARAAKASTPARSPSGWPPARACPILTVDEEIYRYAPGLVIATVDKLAQLPWKGYAGMLFGRVRAALPAARLPARRPGRHAPAARASTTSKDGLPAVNEPARRTAPATGPDHPGRAAPDLRRAGHHGRAVRVGRRRAVHLATYGGRDDRPEDRGLHRHHQTRPRAGARRVRAGPGSLPAAGHRRRRHVLLPAGAGHAAEPGPPLPRRLRARRTASSRRRSGSRRSCCSPARPSSTGTARPPTRT